MTVRQLWTLATAASPLHIHSGMVASPLRIDNGVDIRNNTIVSLTEHLSSDELCRLQDLICRHHTHTSHSDRCSSILVQHIRARIDHVWPMVRQFDNPQAYKHFIKRCSMNGDGRVGSTRFVEVVSGLPAISSTERLEILDEEQHILSFKVVGGQHRLRNYHSVTTLHDSTLEGKPATVVIESYVVDVPRGNTVDETRIFADTIVKHNLQSLARKSENQARHEQGDGRLICCNEV